MKKILTVASLFLTGLLLTSLPAFAQTATAISVGQGIGTFAGLISGFTATVVKAVGGLFMAGAMVAFFFGIVQYIWGAREGDAKKIASGNVFIRWSLVALFVMFSVYGIVRFGQGFICGGPCDTTITIPELDFAPSRNNSGPTTGPAGSGAKSAPAAQSGLFANPGNTGGTVNYRCVEGAECTLSSGGTGLWNGSCTCVSVTGGGGNSAPSSSGGDDCSTDTECFGGKCVNYKCQQ